MSKIGKKPIKVPGGVDVKFNDGFIYVKGPKGELKRELDKAISINIADGNVVISVKDDEKSAIWGLSRALISNMIKGTTEGFEKKLEFEGVGYKANVKGTDLELNLGYSHPILLQIPAGITVKVEKSVITLSGIDNELIGHFAAEIKSKRLPEPYKGSGIRYAGEVIRRKAGKKAATAA